MQCRCWVAKIKYSTGQTTEPDETENRIFNHPAPANKSNGQNEEDDGAYLHGEHIPAIAAAGNRIIDLFGGFQRNKACFNDPQDPPYLFAAFFCLKLSPQKNTGIPEDYSNQQP